MTQAETKREFPALGSIFILKMNAPCGTLKEAKSSGLSYSDLIGLDEGTDR